MITNPVLAWIFTIALAAAGAAYLYRGTNADRVGGVLNLVLCGGMVAMAWPVTAGLPRLPQVLLFGLVAVWFARSAVLDRPRRGFLAFHVGMPVAMVWMVLVMPGGSARPHAEGAHAGMSMGGATATVTTTPASPVLVLVAVVLTAAFAVAGVFWTVRAITTARGDGGDRPSVAGLFADAVMSTGMAVMTGLLI